MSDELKRLKAAMHAATPPVDDDAKARAMALAQKNYAACQGSGDGARPTHNPAEKPAGFVTGVKNMFANLGLRPALLATSSLTVIGLAVVIVMPEYRKGPLIDRNPVLVQEEKVDLDDRLFVETKVLPEVSNSTTGGIIAGAPAPEVSVMAAEGLANRKVAQKPLGLILPADEVDAVSREDRERFATEDSNPLKITVEEPVSTFSIDVDTASYAFVRNALMDGYLPQKDAVRIEEMVNYFPYDYAAPEGDMPFSTGVSVFQAPWNPDTKLVHIAVQGEKPAVEDRPPLDLVFLIDTSGSMHDADKLPLLKQSFRLLLSRLRPEDRVAMVTYAGSSGVVLEPTAADSRAEIMAALDRLEAGGSTAGQAGLQQAYGLAETMHEDGRIGRILLATDGDFNVGISDPEALKSYVEDKREGGTYLSVLGFGRGNYNDALMQVLAQNGNGTASYIDTLSEAQKVLDDQVSGALFPIANDVKIQIEFNPAEVAEYRLIGYETRALAREDFNNDKVDAGDIGAGHSVTAIYEITPVGSPAVMSDPLRYQSETSAATPGEIGFLKLRYKEPGEDESRFIETAIADGEGVAGQEAHFATAIAGFGQLLRDGKYMGDWGYADAIDLANQSKGADPYGYRAEAVTLMRLADSLSR